MLAAAFSCSLICSVGCSKNPNAPVADPLQITPGAYTLSIGSLSLDSPCAPYYGANISFHTPVTITHEGATWYARSTTSADGNIEIAFREGWPYITGTVHGSGVDQNNKTSSRKQFLAFADGAIQSGVAPSPDLHLDFVVGGQKAVVTMTVIDAQSVTTTCLTEVLWDIK